MKKGKLQGMRLDLDKDETLKHKLKRRLTRQITSSNQYGKIVNTFESKDKVKEELNFANDEAITAYIDRIWHTYDVDNSGSLDRMETREFIEDSALLPQDTK